ncbi:MAG: pilus assembly protein PilC [Nitrospirae bacterium CG_4_10_14_0_8_um_filter_41_23]|nr:MAG: pilus assembly protein PilC [Nitrospirae bacterium CG02_land_8_20_14_3_00_41_53]PIW87463.1 MAG: pilus assembly protein PilC [Nitrospirae bacterium CG_4_8_14_3_um_filter_41_47]PIY87195.1 MAG: pilus assembly protein PilC [Nitrospirae bacterium CG_4_10_14_0_8_um_filter_41_23]PJA79703.1 MAG: pilus assembly protein PilC [Nitrospirae bacterium CG_4_9_14_3_um_filter_41_27]
MIESGEITAATKDEVIAQLRKRNITATVVIEKPKKVSRFGLGGKVKDKDIVVFTRQFATMIDAGLPLVQALDILSTQVENKSFGKVLAQVKIDVESGSTYADALKKYPRVFSELYANMVAAGEAGGILDTILNRLSAYIEKAMKLKKKVKGAMVYPAVVTSIAVLVIAVIMIFVVPTFSKMFTTLGGTLPLPTRIVINLSNFIAGIGGLLVAGAIVAIVVFIVQFRRTEKGKHITDKILLRLPIFGMLINKVAVAKFTRTLGTLVSSGVPILDGLEITAKTSGNKVIEYAIMEVRKGVVGGKTLAEPIMKAKVFPPMVTHMIAVGESTGALDAMLGKIADFYDDEVDASVSNLTAMMEPMLMVFLGTAVGFIVISMYLPIFKLITLIK